VKGNRCLALGDAKQALCHYELALQLHRGLIGAIEGKRKALMCKQTCYCIQVSIVFFLIVLGRPSKAVREPCIGGIKVTKNFDFARTIYLHQ
jgi:hypothetical protein